MIAHSRPTSTSDTPGSSRRSVWGVDSWASANSLTPLTWRWGAGTRELGGSGGNLPPNLEALEASPPELWTVDAHFLFLFVFARELSFGQGYLRLQGTLLPPPPSFKIIPASLGRDNAPPPKKSKILQSWHFGRWNTENQSFLFQENSF